MRRRLTGHILAAAAASLWGTLGIFGAWLYRYDLGPLTVITVRVALAFAALAAGLALLRPHLLVIKARDIPFFAVYGLVGVTLYFGLYFYAISVTTVTTIVVLLYTVPALVSVLAALFLRERLTPAKMAALALAFAGGVLLTGAYDLRTISLNAAGVLSGLGAALAGAVYYILSKRARARYSPWTMFVYGLGFGLLFLLAARPDFSGVAHLPAAAWMLFGLLVLLPTLLAYPLYLGALGHIEASVASITCAVEPVVGAALAYALLGERLAAPQVVGGALVMTGVLFVQVSDLRGKNLSFEEGSDALLSNRNA